MKKKVIFQIALVAALFAVGAYLWMNQFKPAKIEVLCDIHAPRIPRNANNTRVQEPRPYDIVFGFNEKVQLTSVEVVPKNEWLTNKFAQPVWHMVSESNTPPLKLVIYGRWVQGMHPAVKGARAEPLQTNVVYHMVITAGKRTGDCDFLVPALPQTAAR